jgi:hypothetical protein
MDLFTSRIDRVGGCLREVRTVAAVSDPLIRQPDAGALIGAVKLSSHIKASQAMVNFALRLTCV